MPLTKEQKLREVTAGKGGHQKKRSKKEQPPGRKVLKKGIQAVGKLDVKRYLLPNFPYLFIFWFFAKIAEGYRLSIGTDVVTKAVYALSGLGELITKNPFPSFHPRDILMGICGAAAVWAAVYMKGKNAKKYRHGVEYGSAR